MEHILSHTYESTILYMVYWYHRLAKKPHEQQKIHDALNKYLQVSDKLIFLLLNNQDIKSKSIVQVENYFVAKKTIDLVLYKSNSA
jgi:hypothetical protein